MLLLWPGEVLARKLCIGAYQKLNTPSAGRTPRSDPGEGVKQPLNEMDGSSTRTGPGAPESMADLVPGIVRRPKTGPTAEDFNAVRLSMRKSGVGGYDFHAVLNQVIEPLAHAAPAGGWKEKEDFLKATEKFFTGVKDRSEQEEGWRVYKKITTDSRIPLIGIYEMYQEKGISVDQVFGLDATTPPSETDRVEWAKKGPEGASAFETAQKYQWLYSKQWTPWINDIYLLGIIHSKTNVAYVPYGENSTGHLDVVKGVATAPLLRRRGRFKAPALSTTWFEIQQLKRFFGDFDGVHFNRRAQ